LLIWLLLFTLPSLAQDKPEIGAEKSGKTNTSDTIVHSPRKATIMSAVLPGLGQIYNRKIWKVPIVYAGLGGFGYFAYYNQSQFNRFKTAYISRQNGGTDEFSGLLSNQGLLNEMDRFRRYRDICALGFLAFYALQIVDANVDANLFDFDVSDDLSINFHPVLYQALPGKPAAGGLCFTLRF